MKEKIAELQQENRALREKTEPELLQELQTKFYNKPGVLNQKELQKI
jgi:hypothetical protein